MIAFLIEALVQQWVECSEAAQVLLAAALNVLVDRIPGREALGQQGFVLLKALKQDKNGLQELHCSFHVCQEVECSEVVTNGLHQSP